MALPPQPDSPAPAGEATLPALPPAAAASAPPAPTARPTHSRTAMVLTGGVVGLIAGLGAGYDHFRKQPAVYESTAVVSGTDPGAVMAPVVLDRAARRLDAMAPFAPPLPGTTSERVAYLNQNLSLQMKDGVVHLAFRGPNPADTPKYLKAVAEAYAVPGARPVPLPPAPGAKAPVTPAPTAPTPTPVDPDAKVAAERAKLQAELAAITGEPIPAVETRLAANQSALKTTQAKLKTTNSNLEAIAAVGTDKVARLALMKKLGVTPDPDRPAAPSAEEKEWQTQLVSFQQKKAELGRRLGPEHRDMLALDEQIAFVRSLLEKSAAMRPTEDALDRHRTPLTNTWAKLNAEASTLAGAVQRDEATLAAAAPVRAKLEQLTGPPAPPLPPMPAPAPDQVTVAPQPRPAAPATSAGPEIMTSPTEGERVSPLLYRSLVPGGAIGLVAGLGLGFVASLVTGAIASRQARERKPKPLVPLKPVVVSAVRRTGATRIAKYDGPALNVPVLGQVPALKPDAPVEKKSVEGWSPALVSFTRPNSAEAEVYRAARRALVEALGSAGHKAVVVTGPGGGGDGKTTTAANLALSLAQSGKRVLLVDCDYHGTKQQELFRLGRLGDSLKSVMMNDVDLRVAVRSCEVANLFLLPAGRGPVDGADVLTRAKFKDLVAELKAQYEYVILDAPPTTAEKELKALAEHADGVVLVVRNAADAPARVATATSEVARAGSKVLGAVVTAAPVPAPAPAPTEQSTPTAV
ncbi:AAA family ATPase [bacterium]|nr:AAA family ATPase [bacterium]